MKECTRCKVKKEEDQFPFKYKYSGQRSNTCRACHKIYVDNHYKNNKEKYAEKAIKNKIIGRNKYIDYKKSLSCTDCNLDFKDAHWLCEFHHLDSESKDFNPAQLYLSFKKFLKEVEKCVPLCANCHRTRHYKESQGDIV